MHADTKRIILVGMGGMGRAWLQSVAADPRWQIVALAEVDDERLREAASIVRLPAEACFHSTDDALSAVPSEAVLVAVPMLEHYACIRSALLAGRHVLTEKPFVTDMGQARELVALAASRRLALGVTQNYRYEAPYRTLGEAIAGGLIGRVATISVRFHRQRPVRSYGVGEPAPFLFQQGVHFLDALRSMLCCEGESAFASSLNPAWSPYRYPARWEGLITMENGVIVQLSGSYVGQGRQTPYAALWRVEGESGDLYVEEAGGGQVKIARSWNDGRDEESLPLQAVRPAQEILLEQFGEACDGGPAMPTSGRDNLGTLALIAALVASSESGQPQKVRSFLQR